MCGRAIVLAVSILAAVAPVIAFTCRTLSQSEAYAAADTVVSVRVREWNSQSGVLSVSVGRSWKGRVPSKIVDIRVSRNPMASSFALQFMHGQPYVLYLLWRESAKERVLTVPACPLRVVEESDDSGAIEREESDLNRRESAIPPKPAKRTLPRD
jgi:hypothetical protein